jgi:hypothetical protein
MALIAPIKADISTVFPHASASDTVPSLWPTLEASTYVASLEDEGVGGSGRATDQRKFIAPKYISCSRAVEFQAQTQEVRSYEKGS